MTEGTSSAKKKNVGKAASKRKPRRPVKPTPSDNAAQATVPQTTGPQPGAPAVIPATGEVIPAGQDEPVRESVHPIAAGLQTFIDAVDGYGEALRVSLPLVAEKLKGEIEDINNRLQQFAPDGLKRGGKTNLVAKGAHAASKMLAAVREIERLRTSKLLQAMMRSYFIGLFSEYDAYFGQLLKVIYSRKPELFKTIRRDISVNELIGFQTLEAVMRDMLDKEIESLRRESYVDQFVELEKKFDIRTLREFSEWSKFVEISQRRNLMTHNDGLVSQQYLTICDREGYVFDKRPQLRERLELTPRYILDAIFVVRKVAFMLTHTLWRRIFPSEIDIAHASLNESLYQFLMRGHLRSAEEFGQFGVQEAMLRKIKRIDRQIRVVNTAIALCRREKRKEALSLLDGEDWSASLREFQLANAVLHGEFAKAEKVMLDIGRKGELINELNYHEWPLFYKFRDSKEFQRAYKRLYGKPFLEKVSETAREQSAKLVTGNDLAVAQAAGEILGQDAVRKK